MQAGDWLPSSNVANYDSTRTYCDILLQIGRTISPFDIRPTLLMKDSCATECMIVIPEVYGFTWGFNIHGQQARRKFWWSWKWCKARPIKNQSGTINIVLQIRHQENRTGGQEWEHCMFQCVCLQTNSFESYGGRCEYSTAMHTKPRNFTQSCEVYALKHCFNFASWIWFDSLILFVCIPRWISEKQFGQGAWFW